MSSLPTPLRAALGLALTAVDAARESARTLPRKVVGLPIEVASGAVQASLRAQQHYTALVTRGDELIGAFRGLPDEPPTWARFDDDPEATPSRATAFDRVTDDELDDLSGELPGDLADPVDDLAAEVAVALAGDAAGRDIDLGVDLGADLGSDLGGPAPLDPLDALTDVEGVAVVHDLDDVDTLATGVGTLAPALDEDTVVDAALAADDLSPALDGLATDGGLGDGPAGVTLPGDGALGATPAPVEEVIDAGGGRTTEPRDTPATPRRAAARKAAGRRAATGGPTRTRRSPARPTAAAAAAATPDATPGTRADVAGVAGTTLEGTPLPRTDRPASDSVTDPSIGLGDLDGTGRDVDPGGDTSTDTGTGTDTAGA